MAVVIKGSGSIEGSTGLEMGANGTTEIRGQVNVAVGSSVAGVSTATNFAPSSVPTSNRNLVINGAMQVAQRGTSSTTSGTYTADRFMHLFSGTDESPTTEVRALTSSDTGPWAKGFRKALKVTNGNQSSGAGADDYIRLDYRFEAQDIAQSGWDHTSSSSYATLSFWAKSSVAQTFYVRLKAQDGTAQGYSFAITFTDTNTWTKFTHSIPGASAVQFDNDNGEGFRISWTLFRGTNMTGSFTLNQWAAFNGSVRMPDNTTTWYTTNDATFELTGVQLEAGQQATPFEHEPYSQTFHKCLRYYEQFNSNGLTEAMFASGYFESDTQGRHCLLYSRKRATPTITSSDASTFTNLNTNNIPAGSSMEVRKPTETAAEFRLNTSTITDANGRGCILISVSSTEATIKVSAEL